MLVEMIEKQGSWYYKDENGVELLATTGGIRPMESLPESTEKVKVVKKLKEAGFTADEIVEFFTAGIFK